MLKGILKLDGVHQLKKSAQIEINGGGKRCNGSCSYTGQGCHYMGHCGCPGECGNVPGSGLQCIPY